jgi:hypothetical protein
MKLEILLHSLALAIALSATPAVADGNGLMSTKELCEMCTPLSAEWERTKDQTGGKPRGTRARITQLAEKLLEDDRDAIIEAVIEAAKNRDPTAMRLCVERLVPLRKGRPVVFDLPPVETAADVAVAIGELSRAMADGELTVDEASAAASVIELHRRAIEMTEIERRLQKLEEASTR